ncbi:TPA: LemA family protein [Streptococcus suis]|nr:LemA family protein [Streptococcus suis]
MKKYLFYLLGFLLLLFSLGQPSLVGAEGIPARPIDTTVVDETQLLSSETIANIDQLNQTWAASEQQLQVGVYVTENYPQLTANQQVSDLITELEGTENRILVARKDYNAVATAYNKKIKRFPTSIYAGLFGYEKVELFQATNDAATTVPSVDLQDEE